MKKILLSTLILYSLVYSQNEWPTSEIYFIEINQLEHIFVATGGGLFRSTDYGEKWTKIGPYTSLHILENGSIIAGSNNGIYFSNIIYLSNDNGETWNQISTVFNSERKIQSFTTNTTGDIFAGTDGAGIFKSSDGGYNWTVVNNGLFRKNILSLVTNSRGEIFAGTVGAGVYRSTNNGGSWASFNNGLYEYGTAKHLIINDQGELIVSCGSVYRFSDLENRWIKLVNDGSIKSVINSLYINLENIFAGSQAHGIYRSTDNGESWNLVNEGILNQSIQHIKGDKSGHLYAGALIWGVDYHAPRMGAIYRSTNNGNSWETLAEPTSIDEKINIPVAEYLLQQNFPNPFNPSTKIEYSVPEHSFILIEVYDMLGKKVATLVNEKKQAGNYIVEFNAENLKSGVYFYRLQSNGFKEVKKLILMK